jgi:alkylhydroperoxidase/carboxymuconolactone decarboxylase family protein YurZ
MKIEEPYVNLFGFVPELTQKRHKFTSEVFPEILDAQEAFRNSCIHCDALEDRTAQLILFAILSSHLREGARLHAIAARRLGTSWKELHAVANLVFLFAGLSAMNFSVKILSDVKETEDAKGL